VVPALNEVLGIAAVLQALEPLRRRGHEVIVVDGGSADGTPQLARTLCDRVIAAPRGRALQMNAGAREARGDALVFLHADTRLPALADEMILSSLRTHVWGRFDVQIDARHPLLKLVGCAMNLRSRLTGIARAPLPGRVKTRLVPRLGEWGAARLQARLTRQAVRTALAARCGEVQLHVAPRIHAPWKSWGVALKSQHGRDLGERMHHALE